MQSIHKSRKSIQINLINQYRLRIRLAHHSRDFGLVYKGLPFNRRAQRQAKSFNSRWQKKLLLCSSGACSSLCNIKWSATEKRGENLENFANQTKHFHTQMPFCPDIGKISVSNPSLILKIRVQTRPGKCVNATHCFVTENRNQHICPFYMCTVYMQSGDSIDILRMILPSALEIETQIGTHTKKKDFQNGRINQSSIISIQWPPY